MSISKGPISLAQIAFQTHTNFYCDWVCMRAVISFILDRLWLYMFFSP